MPPDQRGEHFVAGRFRLPNPCSSADDVRAQAARVRAWRDRAFPSLPPRLTEPPAPQPAPVAKRVAVPPALPPKSLFIQISDHRYQVDSLKQASEMYCAARDAFGEGASYTPEVAIVTADGRNVARISRDGRVWPAEEKPGETPLYDPAAEPLPPAIPGRIMVRLALEVTAAHFGLKVDDLLSDRRTQPLCRRRQIAMYVAHRTTGRSLPFIGKKMGGKDHTTILHGIRTVKVLIDNRDEETVAAVDAIVEQLTGGAHE
jgi:hypothetical protein